MDPAEQDAYKILNQTLGIDYRETSRANLQRLEAEIRASTCRKNLQDIEKQIHKEIDSTELVLARGSRNWDVIEKYGSMLSDRALEDKGIVKTSSTQKVDRETWGNQDFVFFFFGFRSSLEATTLAKKYGTIKFFDSQPLYEKGWISLGDWMEFYNAQAIALPTNSIIGQLTTHFSAPQSADKHKRAQNTRKRYAFNDKESAMQPRRAVDELFFGPEIKAALAAHLILFLRSFCPARLLWKQLGDQPTAALLQTYLPLIEAKLPRAVEMTTCIGQAKATGSSPNAAVTNMLAAGTGTG